MFEYLFERAPVRIGPRGADAGYQEQVAAWAREGWRLVQILVECPVTVPSAYVLVLERPASSAA